MMLRDVAGGMRLGIRNWRSMLSFGLLIAIVSTVLAILLADVITQLSVLRGGQQMREQSATIFTPYYGARGVTEPSDRVLDQLSAVIEEGAAYTTVINNVRVDDPSFSNGVPVVFVIGDAITEVMPSLPTCSPEPCLMRGSDVPPEVLPALQVGAFNITRGIRLPPASALFDANMGAVPLDDRVVVVLPTKALMTLDLYEREEAVSRAVFLGDPSIDVDGYVASSADDGLYLVPHDVAVDQPARLSSLMTMSAMYAVGLIAFLGVVLFAYASVAERTIRNERTAFRIRRAHGAPPAAVAARLAGFVAFVLLVIPMAPLLVMQMLPDPMATAARWISAILLVLGAVMWVYFIRQNRRAEVYSA